MAFVVEEALESRKAVRGRIPQGIVLHEVAHFLGQEKEYYPETYRDSTTQQDIALPVHQQKWFCTFPGKKREPCYKHRIFSGFQASFNLKAPWKFLNKKIPFMNNKPTKLENLWIDRKTFQKVFKTLHNESIDPTSSRLQRIIQRSISPVIFLSRSV